MKRFYLDLEEQEKLSDFQIPDVELKVTQDNQTTVQPILQFAMVISIVPINCQAYGRYDEPTECGLKVQDRELAIPRQSLTEQEKLAEGGADDCLSDEDIGADIEEDYDDKPNNSSEEEEEAQLTESDSNERRAKKLVRAEIIEVLLSSDTKDDDYRDSTEEDDELVMDVMLRHFRTDFLIGPLPADTEDEDYRDSTEEDDGEVNK
ncbi:hypothetical protein L211DRAFT_854319 [Terfezia boudieri ATCC MYA-4762]|uniref:Uncharacterized protein n=1 Tax=Terfezia boudieri ATCC MYA-4762 TaxID=1051890 RepID=A0A3N4L9U6_9PEZI|nr:hypothetical protein L211DRAFT_854319 [Terfezia boudieri ATCC MYA-4762]